MAPNKKEKKEAPASKKPAAKAAAPAEITVELGCTNSNVPGSPNNSPGVAQAVDSVESFTSSEGITSFASSEKSNRKTKTSFKLKASPAKLKSAKGSARTPTSTGKNDGKDGKDELKMVVIKNGDSPGIIVHWEPTTDKNKQTGPYSAKVMFDMVKAGYDFNDDGMKFEKRSFVWKKNGNPVNYGRYGSRSFVLLGIETKDLTKEMLREMANLINEAVNEEYESTSNYGKPPSSVHDDFLVEDNTIECYDDILGDKESLTMLKYQAKIDFRKVSDGFPNEGEDTWGLANLATIESYFRKGTMKRNEAIKLGLPAGFCKPDERDE